MEKEELREIFNLMFEKLKSLQKDGKFSKVVEKRRKVTKETFDECRKRIEEKGENFDNYLFEKMAFCIFVAGFSSKTVDEKYAAIKKAFDDFDVQKVADYDEKKIKGISQNKAVIRNEKKIESIAENARKIREIQKKNGSFAEYIKSFDDINDLAGAIRKKFKWMGQATVWDYLKDIGFDAIKPDVHVVRILYRLGLISENKLNEKTEREIFEVAEKMSRATREPKSVIDAVIWLYGAERTGEEVKYPICTGKNPRCNECNLTNYCRYERKS